MAKRYSDEIKKEILEKYHNGLTKAEINEKYGLGKGILDYWIKKEKEFLNNKFLMEEDSNIVNDKIDNNNISIDQDFVDNHQIIDIDEKVKYLKNENLFLRKLVSLYSKEINNFYINKNN